MASDANRLAHGARVHSARFGRGRVEFDKGDTAIVRFDHGIEECLKQDLTPLIGACEILEGPSWQSSVAVITRSLAAAIQSVNDQWGVFSRSRIALLPHQLWVCNRVLASLPTRWLVADDVGLGKTIEAGLILWPLLAKGVVKRLLVLCPASLVEQWHARLGDMFDIRLAQYVPQADTAKTHFWDTHHQVVASLQTLRADHRGRHDRLFEGEPWDLLIVDEAHHLNADEEAGPTLGYKLVQKLVDERRVNSMVFFTGTPHRGKNFGFLSLLRLLRPDLFDPKTSLRQQLPRLKDVMIRNNKQNATDLQGNRLFRPPVVFPETYTYSDAESRFYGMLTEFIYTGRAYASSLGTADARLVSLVLIAMQKLASSSVAAIRRALQNRLARIEEQRKKLRHLQERRERVERDTLSLYEAFESTNDEDELSKLEEEIVALETSVRLSEDEEPQLRQLIAAANEVTGETKVAKILSLLETRFADRTVLFFTEYKATQSMLMSALIRRFGEDCVTFINGDDKAEGVVAANGAAKTVFEDRESAADKLNTGRCRFLVSTEAGGEGIDLQERCHTLIHVDLPWNPMRLHQRVGRLNRYGQTQQVEVVTVRNPNTVESRIWDKLNEKIDNIMLALSQVVDGTEDLLQLILGMTSPSLFRQLFSDASQIPESSLSSWFDSRTASFGGKDVLQTVSELVGHCAQFDFQQVSSRIPPLDLPALRPFIETMLAVNHRRIRREDDRLSFKTPEAWLTEPAVRTSYEGLHFDRKVRARDAALRILGVGHKVVDHALQQALSQDASVCSIGEDSLAHPLVLARITDRVTGKTATRTAVVAGALLVGSPAESWEFCRDWQVVKILNGALVQGVADADSSARAATAAEVMPLVDKALAFIKSQIDALALAFELPEVELLTVLWPIAPGQQKKSSAKESSASN